MPPVPLRLQEVYEPSSESVNIRIRRRPESEARALDWTMALSITFDRRFGKWPVIAQTDSSKPGPDVHRPSYSLHIF